MKWIKMGISNVFLFVSITAFGQDNYDLSGIIDKEFNNQPIMLFTFKNDTVYTVDTTTIKDETFRFQGKEYLEDFAMLSTGNYPGKVKSLEVALQRGNINVSMIEDRIGGTSLNNLYQAYQDSNQVYAEKIMEERKKQGSEGVHIHSPLYNMYVAHGRFTVKFKIDNISNVVGRKIFRDEARSGHFGEEFAYGKQNVFQMILDAADEDLRNQAWVKDVSDRMAEDAQTRIGQGGLVNKVYTDFEFQTPTGETKKLSDYVGKSEYLVIDFWASWCGPCIAEIPNLKRIYEKYKDDGLEMISVSLDNSKSTWLKAIDRVDAPWVHLNDFNGSRSALTDTYHIWGIPFIILLDKNGIIRNINLRGQQFDELLDMLLKKNR
jgi:thiol-disulfide isomerase/thioredoxin